MLECAEMTRVSRGIEQSEVQSFLEKQSHRFRNLNL
jgi:hypothetical protein